MLANAPTTLTQNRILALLAGDEFSRLLPALEPVTLRAGDAIYEADEIIGAIYFPLSCVLAVMGSTANGASTQLAMTGNDGLAGTPLVLGADASPHRVIVQCAGNAYRMRAETMRWELDQGGELKRIGLLYAQTLTTQMARIMMCSRHHSVEQQLGRWLLSSLDRLSGNQIQMTQEQLASMLGIRREAVTEAAGKLQQAGLISYSRGRIVIIDRPGLEARSCECYVAARSEYTKLIQPPTRNATLTRPRANPATLRMRAEARLALSLPEIPDSPPDIKKLVRELQLRQFELEIHNEELGHSYAEVDALRSRYADLYDFAPTGYCTVDARGAILQTNLSAAILLGIKRSQVRRHRFGDSVSPESLLAFHAFLLHVLSGDNQQTCEIVLMATEQRPAAVVSIKGVADESGHECRMVIVDITERRHAEARLQESEALNIAVLNSLTAHVAVIDDQGRVLAVNAAWKRFAAENGSEALAIHSPGCSYRDACRDACPTVCSDASGKAEAEPAWRGIEQVLNGLLDRFTLDYPCDSPTQQRWFRMSVFPLLGAVRGAVIAHENITPQKQAELALREREQYQRALLDSFPFLVWLKDEQSRFLAVNQPLADAFGFPSTDSLIGKTDFDIATTELAERYRADDRAVLDSGLSKYVEEWIESDGKRRWVETYKTPVSLDGKIIGTVGYARDITGHFVVQAEPEPSSSGRRQQHRLSRVNPDDPAPE